MVESDFYSVIDDVNLIAIVNLKKGIEVLKEKIKEIEDHLHEIAGLRTRICDKKSF